MGRQSGSFSLKEKKIRRLQKELPVVKADSCPKPHNWNCLLPGDANSLQSDIPSQSTIVDCEHLSPAALLNHKPGNQQRESVENR